MVDEQETTIRIFIVTKWDTDGEPAAYKSVRQCTVEEIRAHVVDLRRKTRALQKQIANLAVYVTGTMESVKDMRADTLEVPHIAACAPIEQEQAHEERGVQIDTTAAGMGDRREPGAGPGATPGDGHEPDAG